MIVQNYCKQNKITLAREFVDDGWSGGNFDSDRDNVMAPFQFAMNEVYLRDGSRKVKDVLRIFERAARASDTWNYATVKRVLKNPVYLGHTAQKLR